MTRSKLESQFSTELKKDIEDRFPGCYVLKQDPNMRQGIPDLLVLYEDKWAAIETKREPNSSKRVNQEWHVERMDAMSFARFANQRNREEVLHDLQEAFGVGRQTLHLVS